MVLLHGLSDSGLCWGDAVSRWAGRWRLLAVDQRGHGTSPRFTDEQRSRMMQVLADDLVGLLDQQDAPVVLVGHSLGGRAALMATLERPDAVRAAVLEDPSTRVWDNALQEHERFGDYLDRFDGHAREEVLAGRVRGWPEVELQPWVQAKRQTDRRMVDELDFGRFDGLAGLRRVQVPTLVLRPEGSTQLPPDDEPSNPLVTTMVLDGVGHCIRRDDPERFHRIVDDFLAEHA